MSNANDVLETMTKNRMSYAEIARRAGLSRTTIYSMVDNPENSTVKRLRKFFRAMGYNLTLTLEPIEKETS